jgi:hypothetical protein
MIRAFFILALVASASAAEPVSFRKDVLPILGHHCFKCHSGDKAKGDLDFKSRASVFDREEPILVPGHSDESTILALVMSTDDDRMPPTGRSLNAEEISVLERWINEGASWDDASLQMLARKADFRLAATSLPAGDGHPIDRWLAPYFLKHGVDASATVDDRLFARRLWFDVIGLPPPTETLAAFLADTRLDKRERLIDQLLADNEGYAARWMTFWQDHLRDGTRGVDEAGNPFCPDHYHVRPITPWLKTALLENKPYDVFVRELVNPPDLPRDPYKNPPDGLKKLPRDSSGFLQGIRLGGATPTAVQSAEVQMAQNLGQVFLGVQLKCATCHDSYVDGWKQADVWGLAGIYSDTPLEMFRAEIATGTMATPKFLFPDLDLVSPTAPVRERMQQLATSITRPENGLFARTIVNRIWAQLMGNGLVTTLDDMAEPAWHPDLLDWLAADFIAHRYDLKHLIRRILTSRAWQMPAVREPSGRQTPFVFRGPALRRLTAEQLIDTVYAFQGRPHRAWEQRATPLFDAMGRPDRQLVATTRDSEATMLQALEAINGRTLHELLKETTSAAASPEQGDSPNDPAARVKKNRPVPIAVDAALPRVAEQRFSRALSRDPTERERTILRGIFGANPSLDDLADATWLIVMKPEFQLLR